MEGVEAWDSGQLESRAGRERGAAARLRAGGAHAGLLGGSPLSLLQGIIPGKNCSILGQDLFYLPQMTLPLFTFSTFLKILFSVILMMLLLSLTHVKVESILPYK